MKVLPIIKGASIAVVALLGAGNPITVSYAQAQGDVKWARAGNPDTLDPQKYGGIESAIIISNIFDTLIWRNGEDNKYYGGLASKWEYGEDYKSLYIELRSDVVFHDGSKFNAEAVGFTFDRIRDPSTGSTVAATLLTDFSGYEILGEYSIRLLFGQPSPLFLESLTQTALAPISPAAVQKYGEEFGDHPVGTGPFRFAEWSRATQEVKLEKNADYNWAPNFMQHQGVSLAGGLVFKGILDASARLAALEAGEVDLAALIPPVYLSLLSSDPDYSVVGVPSAGITHSFAFNTKKWPLDDIAVRKALIASVDLEGLAKSVFRDLQLIPTGPFRKGLACWDATARDAWPYDPKDAKEMLWAAGWTEGADGVRTKDGKRLEITALWPNSDDVAPAVYIQNEWKKLGADLQIRQMDFSSVISDSMKGNHQITWGSVAASDPDITRTVFKTGGARNFTGVSDEVIDDLIVSASRTPDTDERCQFYSKLQHRVMEQALILPYYDALNYYVARKNVSGLSYKADGVTPIHNSMDKTKD